MWVVSAFILRKIWGPQVTPAPSFVWRKISQHAYGLAANTAWNRGIIISLLVGIFASTKYRRQFSRLNFRIWPIGRQLVVQPLIFTAASFPGAIWQIPSFFQPSHIVSAPVIITSITSLSFAPWRGMS